MKLYRIVALCAIVAAAGYLAADDGGGMAGSGNAYGGGGLGSGSAVGGGTLGSGSVTGGMGNGNITSNDDGGGAAGSGNVIGGGGLGSGNAVGGGMGNGHVEEYRDGNGARFIVIAFDDGSWFAFGME